MLAIVGTVGVPANYGGFETLVENLLDEADAPVQVYCSGKHYSNKLHTYKNAHLKYVNLAANGPQSILYDVVSIFRAVRSGATVLLVLGVSGALVLPLVRLFSSVKIVSNIDGLEWKRDKWSWPTKKFLKLSEWLAVKFSHSVIADNQAISDYVSCEYGKESAVIAYGGDHAVVRPVSPSDDDYSFCVCRIEPENNIHKILEAYKCAGAKLRFVGNWNSSDYGRDLKKQYSNLENIEIIGPVYDLDELFELRSRCSIYVHGHSAGGTNPSLVEAMHFGKPILSYDCSYNRATTENCATYFKGVNSLIHILNDLSGSGVSNKSGEAMAEIASRRYVWSVVKRQYQNICSS